MLWRKSFGSELLIVEGSKDKIPEELYDLRPFRIPHNRRIRPETGGRITRAAGAAMSREEALRCIQVGIEMADSIAVHNGFEIMGLGEMGIGNTTSSAGHVGHNRKRCRADSRSGRWNK